MIIDEQQIKSEHLNFIKFRKITLPVHDIGIIQHNRQQNQYKFTYLKVNCSAKSFI